MASNYNLDENNFDIRITWDSEVEKIFIREKIYTRHPWRVAGTFSRGDVVTIPGAWTPERYASMPRRGFANFGAFTYCMAENISMRVTAGRYCSIAAGVEVMGDSHPVERVSTHLWSYREHMQLLAQQEFGQSVLLHPYDAASEVVQLGNDVWIGQEAMIKGGVKIGDGAVVAARAVVTKDVAPYTVVAGVPAKPIRMRFDQPTIDRLIDAQWWQYNFADFGELDPRQPNMFLDNLAHMLNIGQIKTFSPGYVHMAEILEAELS